MVVLAGAQVVGDNEPGGFEASRFFLGVAV